MKKLIALLVLFFFAGTCFAQSIVGTDHDLTTKGWFTGDEICVACHTPHNADITVTDSPLWNHEVTTASYTLYTSSTLDASDMGQPDGKSKLCLSCHDGTVALDSYGGATGTNMIPGAANLGTDLSDDHPISFTYNTALSTADGGLEDPSTASSSLGGTIAEDMLFSDKLECASCHNAHNNVNGNFLVMVNTNSALCLTCHIK